jgi:hypothetical protein
MVNFQPLQPAKDTELYFKFREKLFFPKRAQYPGGVFQIYPTKKCRELIINHPEVFYYHYYYNFPEFDKIQKMTKQVKM